VCFAIPQNPPQMAFWAFATIEASSVVLRGGDRRDAYEDEEGDEDRKVVGFEDTDKLDGKWEIEELSGRVMGKSLCIRS